MSQICQSSQLEKSNLKSSQLVEPNLSIYSIWLAKFMNLVNFVNQV